MVDAAARVIATPTFIEPEIHKLSLHLSRAFLHVYTWPRRPTYVSSVFTQRGNTQTQRSYLLCIPQQHGASILGSTAVDPSKTCKSMKFSHFPTNSPVQAGHAAPSCIITLNQGDVIYKLLTVLSPLDRRLGEVCVTNFVPQIRYLLSAIYLR